jgi:hypothetical protein
MGNGQEVEFFEIESFCNLTKLICFHEMQMDCFNFEFFDLVTTRFISYGLWVNEFRKLATLIKYQQPRNH